MYNIIMPSYIIRTIVIHGKKLEHVCSWIPYMLCYMRVLAPAGRSEQVNATTLSSTDVLVEWEEVADIDLNGVLTKYEVSFRPAITFGGLISDATDATNNTYLVLTNLEEDVGYNISVRAFTNVGAGPSSESVFTSTFIDGKACVFALINCQMEVSFIYIYVRY